MLVRCQICTANVSDQAAACPKCSSEKSAFLGPETDCYECGARAKAAYQVCSECGAPRTSLAAPESLHIEPHPPKRKSGLKLPKPLPASQKQRLNKTSGSNGVTAAVLAALTLSLFAFIYPMVPEADTANRFAGAIGSGFTVLIISSITWLLTVAFHRIPFSQWHRSSGWAVFWIPAVALFGIIGDKSIG